MTRQLKFLFFKRYRKCLSLLLGACLVVGASPSFAQTGTPAESKAPETLLLQSADLSDSHIAFVYARDIWLCPRKPEIDATDLLHARRLTSGVGAEVRPRFSPDGKWIAYSAQYEGNTDVFVISIFGGVPKRLTYHPQNDVLQDWHPDGKSVYFTSSRDHSPPVGRLYQVGLEGGFPTRLKLPRVASASLNQAGTHFAYQPIYDAFQSWKRYRGGRLSPIWIFDRKTNEIEEVPHVRASDALPVWFNGAVYFLSDRDKVMNLYRYQPGSNEVEQLTSFKEFDIRSLAAGPDYLIFSQAGRLHLFNTTAKAYKTLRIHIASDGLGAKPYWANGANFIRDYDLSPSGNRAVFESRGEIVTVPKEEGFTRTLSASPGAHDRSPRWSPDGRHIAWFSDYQGEYALYIQDCKGTMPAVRHDVPGPHSYFQLEWSPDSKKIAFSDKSGRLSIYTIKTKKVEIVADNIASLGVFVPAISWHPQSHYLAYEKADENTGFNKVCVYDLSKKASKTLTDQFAYASDPCFSADGNYLYFFASVNLGPHLFGLNMSAGANQEPSGNLYLVTLKQAAANPFLPKNDDSVVIKEPKNAPPKPKKNKKKVVNKVKVPKKLVTIDWDHIQQRILALPYKSGIYYQLSATQSGLLFVSRKSRNLKHFVLKSKQAKTVFAKVNGYRLASQGKKLLIRTGNRYSISDLTGKAVKVVPTGKIRIRVEPAQEWRQILHEAWRIQRDYFYDKNMHGVDWEKSWQRWSSFLPHCRHRSDLNWLLREMLGDLSCGHEYVRGGAYASEPQLVNVGLLGADIIPGKKYFKIAKIYRGQNWNPGLTSPLSGPGLDIKESDAIIAVNQISLTVKDNFYAAFVQLAGQRVQLKLKRGKKVWTEVVTPISNEGRLRQLDWIEQKRRMVAKLSNDQLAYIYMPDTARSGKAAFDRDFFSQCQKAGLILDERFNRGGKVADYVISTLSRQRLCYWMTREQWVGQTPFAVMDGPKVMIINERSGSGGDAMPWMFKRQRLGALVGTRTWGGLVGISGVPVLMDGGSVTSAAFGIMNTDGKWIVENEGVTPDVEVIQTPKAIIEGRDPQLEKAVAIALEQLKSRKAKPKPEYTPPTPR